MSDKKNKTARIDMRVVPELNERVKELAENLGISRYAKI
jgi:predicted DNA-binding protein